MEDERKQVGQSEVIEARRIRVYPKRVPGSLSAERRRDVVAAVQAGRSVHQVAADAPCATVVVLELCLRDQERRLRELERGIWRREAA